jgi:VIT1/CCC1 family predicted Fe2+/Mn2+ transporter
MTLSKTAELRSETAHSTIDPDESHVANRLNWLRAGVLGANDGIVSTAGLVVGVAAAYAAKGLSAETARVVARELTDRDAFAAHIDVELGIDPDELSNPWQAALSSAVAFLSVLIALVLSGTVSAILGGARKTRAVARVVLGGALAMLVTYSVGQMAGATI